MKKFVFIFAVALTLLCNISVKSQSEDLVKRTQEEMVKTVDWFYEHFKDFDRECFLAGTLADKNGYYQTLTANKSSDEINDKVKWLFEKDLKFIPDTMRRLRITTYEWQHDILALFVIALFKNDYPDLQALRVYSVYPFIRHYRNEIKTADDKRYSAKNYDVELFSPSLAKTMAGYYNFDYDNVSAVSSGGDIGHRGVINREKIVTDAQKMSFLAGVLIRYNCFYPNTWDGISTYSIPLPNSHSTLKESVDILKEFGCDIVKEFPTGGIGYSASDKIRNLTVLVHDLVFKMAADD
ncbi:MAG: hypothetical protein LBS55_08500 [Prevotellaceae bacterium]|jgi:hypothetical protein|nr:hypothetical protein [Prevotellaceae bacterium]